MYDVLKYYLSLFILLFSLGSNAQPCFPDQVVTAAFAKGGTSPYINKVLWLTWGSTLQNQTANPYGTHNQSLKVGDKSRASIHLGGNSYLCIEVEIVSLSGGAINSYSPGKYSGDSMDKLYNIGGTAGNNKLVSGIINRDNGQTSKLKFRAKATLNGLPIRLTGLAIADAESLSPSEYIYATAYGSWNVVDIRKNLSSGTYNIAKRYAGENQQRIEFQKGNDQNTGAVAFLEFNQYAYNPTDFSVEFSAELKGSGLTALAIGLLTPTADLGDAPESYGSPYHLIQNLSITSDGISQTNNGNTNINSTSYRPGALQLTNGKFLGTTPPDNDYITNFSKDALGDNLTGTAGMSEEDAWPESLRSFSYKTQYVIGNKIIARIPFQNGQIGDRITGWIDFDSNGTFDASERQTQQITSQDLTNKYVTLTWTIPFNRKTKSTYVRLRYFDSKEEFTSPTQSVNFGEIEDHRIVILAPRKTNPTLRTQVKTLK